MLTRYRRYDQILIHIFSKKYPNTSIWTRIYVRQRVKSEDKFSQKKKKKKKNIKP